MLHTERDNTCTHIHTPIMHTFICMYHTYIHTHSTCVHTYIDTPYIIPAYMLHTKAHVCISYVHTHINIIHTLCKYTCTCTYHINTHKSLLKFKMLLPFKHKRMSLFACIPHVYGCLQSPEEASDPLDLD